MKISRKMQQQVELKIRHAMATGPLHIDRHVISGPHRKHELGKSDPESLGHSK